MLHKTKNLASSRACLSSRQVPAEENGRDEAIPKLGDYFALCAPHTGARKDGTLFCLRPGK